MKKLVVFYSLSGNTRAVARRIARSLRADLMEIRTVKTYPDDYDVLLSLGEKEVKAGYMPQIEALLFDANKYDTVILGTPVWWGTYAPAVKKFLSAIKWKGKKVYPFATNGGELGHTAHKSLPSLISVLKTEFRFHPQRNSKHGFQRSIESAIA